VKNIAEHYTDKQKRCHSKYVKHKRFSKVHCQKYWQM